jgi:hypothetical protein
MLIWCIIYIIVCASTSYMIESATASCSNPNYPRQWQLRTVMLWFCVACMTPFCIWLLVVVWHLRKHANDGYGLLNEFKWLTVGCFIIPISIATSKFVKPNDLGFQTSYIYVRNTFTPSIHSIPFQGKKKEKMIITFDHSANQINQSLPIINRSV